MSKKRKEDITGECYLDDGESGLVCWGLADYPQSVTYSCSCKSKTKDGKCTSLEKCDFRRDMGESFD